MSYSRCVLLVSALVVLFAHQILALDSRVKLSYGEFVGVALPNSITQWLGIPFAAVPVGNLRFAPPIDPPVISKSQLANKQGPLCISTGANPIPASQSEDCLYLAVYAPTTARSGPGLPVFFFIQGGGFNSDANPNLNGTGLIEASGNNIVVVTFNYRVGPWGFLASSSSSSGTPTANNGLRDQVKALEWVQKHISTFGGDPNHVVLGGDSAGAASISLHLAAHGGRDDHLFHAAAAESISFGQVLTTKDSQYQYDNLAQAVGCNNADATISLQCLRSKSASEIQQHNVNIPFPGQSKPPLYMFSPTVDGDFVTDITYESFKQGKFINVPVIIGDDTNGGTVFVPKSTSSQQESNNFLTNHFPLLTKSQLNKIAELYPKPSGKDCPADDKCWWRQASNVYGDMRYMCPSLYISSAYANLSVSAQKSVSANKEINTVTYFVGGGSARSRRATTSPLLVSRSKNSKSWAYRYNVQDPDQVTQGLGVPHTVELNAIFGPNNVPAGAAPASYHPGKQNANIVPVMQAYWTSFIRTFDPNTHRLPGSAEWGQYYSNSHEPQRLVFQNGGTTQMELVDGKTRVHCAYLQGIGPDLRQKV